MDKYCTQKYNTRQSYNDFIPKDIEFMTKRKLKFIGGFFDHEYREITLFGNTEKINNVIRVINHEIIHGIITKVLDLKQKISLAYHLFMYDHEYITRLMERKFNRKVLEKYIDFIDKLSEL